MTAPVIWISGASSGIGAALARDVPFPRARLFGVSRRSPAAGEHLPADLSQPAVWAEIAAHFDAILSEQDVDQALFLHFAGNGAPHGTAADAEMDEYTRSVLLNSASGQVLGKAFLGACERHSVRATLVLASSPAAAAPMVAMSHYGAGKAAIEYWVGAVAAESGARATVFAVVPFAVDTPMLREAMGQPDDLQPLGARLREAASRGELASPETAAAQIWELISRDDVRGQAVPIGAVPADAGGG